YSSAPGVPQRARIDPPGRNSSTSQIISSPSGTPHRTRWSMSAKAFQTAEVGWSMSAPRLIVAVIGPGESEMGSFTEEHHLVSVGVGGRGPVEESCIPVRGSLLPTDADGGRESVEHDRSLVIIVAPE